MSKASDSGEANGIFSTESFAEFATMRSTTKGDAELRPPADSDAEESATLSPTMEEDDDDDKEADDVNVEEAKVESAAV